MLCTVGLWYVMRMSAIKFHFAMLMEMMERWNVDTSTFLLPMRDMIVSLKDVYHILHLLIRGETVRYQSNCTKEDYRREKIYVIGRVMLSEMRGHIMVNWLLHQTDEILLLR